MNSKKKSLAFFITRVYYFFYNVLIISSAEEILKTEAMVISWCADVAIFPGGLIHNCLG